MITRRAALASALILLGFRPARAQSAPVQAFCAALQAVMRAGRATPFAQRAATLRPVVVATFDLEKILQASIGVRWASVPDAMKTDVLAAFTEFTVATWVANFDAYAGERFDVAADLRKIGEDEVVTTRIVPAQGEPTRLDYVMRSTGGVWRAVDILVDGSISRVAVQRSDFRGVLAKGDAALLDLLRSKAADLASGGK